jgi:hypothetical protein
VGDFNLDGKPDLAVANFGSNNVTILLGNGSGSFIAPSSSPVGAGQGPASVAVGDFNLDGKPDLAVANAASGNVTILLGNGSGGFIEPAGSPVGTGTQTQSVAVGDFNLDGKPDLAVVDIDSSTGTLQLNTCTANNSPTIGGAALARQQGAAGTVSTIATVADAQDLAGDLKVTATSVPAGLSVTGIANTNGTVTATVAACTAALGKHLVELQVTDSGSLTATDNLTVNVTASNPPAITLKPSFSLFPNDHKYRTVAMHQMVQSVSDDCDGNPFTSVVIEKVTSDEPDNAPGGGNTTNDIVIAGDCRSVQLRAERDGTKNGRVYTVTLRLGDASGNTTRHAFKVTVPLNQSGAPAVEDAVALTVHSSCP